MIKEEYFVLVVSIMIFSVIPLHCNHIPFFSFLLLSCHTYIHVVMLNICPCPIPRESFASSNCQCRYFFCPVVILYSNFMYADDNVDDVAVYNESRLVMLSKL